MFRIINLQRLAPYELAPPLSFQPPRLLQAHQESAFIKVIKIILSGRYFINPALAIASCGVSPSFVTIT